MKILRLHKRKTKQSEKGFSLPEVLIVLIILSIMAVLALPQIIASRRVFRFSGMQRQFVASLSDARQAAMTQRIPITFRYNNSAKKTIVYGGSFGAYGDKKNLVTQMTGSGIGSAEIVYGRPTGATAAALGDSSNMTAVSGGVIDVVFQADGSVVDAANTPINTAFFFYHKKYSLDTAFAVSVLGAGGRVKIWRYNKGAKVYVE